MQNDLAATQTEIADLEELSKVATDDGESAAAAAESSDEGEDAEPAMLPEEIESKIAQLEDEAKDQSDVLYTKIIEFINSSGLVEGQELTPQQEAAFNAKAELDIAIAHEYIDAGGDYQKAINIYDQALRNNPDNELLLAAKAEAERLQHMDEERFALAKKGMTEDEVREALGTVKHTNARDFPEKSRKGWFYRKENGGAAGVYFKEKNKGEGDWVVEITDFEAVKPPGADDEEEGGE
jgi:tetratricopeptide (TPR) repeat protein